MAKKRKRHTPEQIVKKLRDADAMLNAGQELAVVLQALSISEATFHRWRNQYGGMKSEQAKRLKQFKDGRLLQRKLSRCPTSLSLGRGRTNL